MKIIDAHSHIDYITHLYQDDVCGTIVCTTNESEWGKLIDMANSDNNIYCAFGIHPWFVNDVQTGFQQRLENVLKTNRLYLVGEIGLDKFKPDMEKQIEAFKIQLDIAVKLKRNIFIHCVGAWDKILHILKHYKKSELPIIIAHDFNGSEKISQYLIDNYNIMFSFGKNVICGRKSRIEQIPNDKILVETDGKESVELKSIVEKISNEKNNLNMDDVIYNNTLKVLENE